MPGSHLLRPSCRAAFRVVLRARLLGSAAALALALVLTQMLGLIHGVVHAPHASEASVVAPEARSAASGIEALFDGHESPASCDLYDQLLHGDLLWHGATAAVTAAGGSTLPAARLSPCLARPLPGFRVRGPPRVS